MIPRWGSPSYRHSVAGLAYVAREGETPQVQLALDLVVQIAKDSRPWAVFQFIATVVGHNVPDDTPN